MIKKKDLVVSYSSILEVVQSGFHYSGGECDYLVDDCLLFFCVEVYATVVYIAI